MHNKSLLIIRATCILLALTCLSISHAKNILMVEITTTLSEPIKLSVNSDLTISVSGSNVTISNPENSTSLSVNDIKSFRYIMEEQDAITQPTANQQHAIQWDGKTLSIKGAHADDTCNVLTAGGSTVIQTPVSSISDVDFSKLPRGVYIIVTKGFPPLKISL